jgi:hypothetical protein
MDTRCKAYAVSSITQVYSVCCFVMLLNWRGVIGLAGNNRLGV